MFATGTRVNVSSLKAGLGVIEASAGGGDYLVRLDDGTRVAANKKDLAPISVEPAPEIAMVTKGSSPAGPKPRSLRRATSRQEQPPTSSEGADEVATP